jgi:cyclase
MSVNRREFLYLSSAAIAAWPLRSMLVAQAGQATPPATAFETIRRNAGYFTGRGGTIGWLVNPDAVVVIDTQFPDTAEICLGGLKERSKRGVDLLFNTHHHGDHVGGNGVFRPATKRIITHARVPELSKAAAKGQNAAPAVAPDATFDKTWAEAAGDERVRATHYGPAHTSGDAVIYFERANVAHLGDLLFHQLHPFIDRSSGASAQGWITTLEAVTKELPADAVYLAGHARQGQPVTVSSKDVLRLRDYLDAAMTHVRAGITAGRSQEEIVKVESLKGFDDFAASGTFLTLANTLTAVHAEVAGTVAGSG